VIEAVVLAQEQGEISIDQIIVDDDDTCVVNSAVGGGGGGRVLLAMSLCSSSLPCIKY